MYIRPNECVRVYYVTREPERGTVNTRALILQKREGYDSLPQPSELVQRLTDTITMTPRDRSIMPHRYTHTHRVVTLNAIDSQALKTVRTRVNIN